jgi:hypothetical protein
MGSFRVGFSKRITTKVGLSVAWLVVSSVIALFVPFMYQSELVTLFLTLLLFIGTFIVAYYFAYRFGLFIDHILVNANTSLFAKRVVSSAMSLSGLLFLIAFYLGSSTLLLLFGTSIGLLLLAENLATLCLGFFVGLLCMGLIYFPRGKVE